MEPQTNSQQSEVVVGDEKFTPDQLQEYVRLGKMAKEVEVKQNTKIDKVMGAWTRDTQEKKQYAERVKELEAQIQQQSQSRVQQHEGVTQDQVRAIRDQLHAVGALTEENVSKVIDKMVEERVSNMFAGRDLLSQSKKAIKQTQEAYGVEADLEELLTFMNDEGIKNPMSAIKLKYESDIEKAKERKFSESRGNGIFSSNSTRAKSPRYEIDYKDKDKVRKAISETLTGEV